MNILICLNESYIDYYLITLFSLMKTNEKITVYVFHADDLSEESIDRIRKMAELFSNTVINIKINVDEILDLPNNEWPIEAWLRHFALSKIPQNIDRILYLDGDIIVNDSILTFYNMDMKNNCYAATMDRPINGQCNEKKDEERFANLGMKQNGIYVNAGVLLINLRQIRRYGYVQEDYWDYAREKKDFLLYPDQDLLNGMFAGRIAICDEKIYNCQINTYAVEEANYYIKHAKIIHYTSFRPWDIGYKRVKAGKVWWKYAIRMEKRYIFRYVIWLLGTWAIVLPRKVSQRIQSWLLR